MLRRAGKDSPDDSCPDLTVISELISLDTVVSSIAPITPVTRKLKRFVCYELAELYPKRKPTKSFVLELQGIRHYVKNSEGDIRSALDIGLRWKAIVSWISEEPDRPLTGILHVLEDTTWVFDTNWQTALDRLTNKSEIIHEAKTHSKRVNDILTKIRAHLTFVPSPEPWVGYGGIQQTIATVLEVFPNLQATEATDAAYLLVLLSFFANHEISIDILCRGASPQKRWSKLGEIIKTYPADFGLLQDLIRICSSENLMNTLSDLHSISAILWKSRSSFKLNETVRDTILSNVSASLKPFWGTQAFTLVYRSIPWKSLDNMELDTSLVISHIRHTLRGARHYCGLENISPIVRTDMALSLIEASRFSNLEWKRFIISQAEELTTGLDDGYMHSCLVQRKCILDRLSGKTDLDFPILPDVIIGHADIRLHAALGHTLIQGALNHIQRDELNNAIDLLEKWRPNKQPSAMEYVALFRQNLILGKIFRYQGNFTRSLSCLKISRNIAQVTKDLIFREDESELACELADTYLELNKPAKGEACLRAEMKHHQYSKQGPLVVLAETLFAQENFEEADEICLLLQPSLNLKKIVRLRLSIVRAKLSHAGNQLNAAFSYWTEAMDNLRLFNLASGHTTSIILRSQCDVLRRQGHLELERQSKEQLKNLKECAGSDGARYWIAGLRQWLERLERQQPENLAS